MPKRKFKNGDIVKKINYNNSLDDTYEGDKYLVTGYIGHERLYAVKDSNGYTRNFFPNELELHKRP